MVMITVWMMLVYVVMVVLAVLLQVGQGRVTLFIHDMYKS